MRPVVASKLLGSNVKEPDTPSAVPVIFSIGASETNSTPLLPTALFIEYFFAPAWAPEIPVPAVRTADVTTRSASVATMFRIIPILIW